MSLPWEAWPWASGRLVDDAIVVLENIYRHRSAGESPDEAAIQGAGEVGLAVLASTITTIIVFLPVVFITGIAKLLFTPLALTVAFSLIASYFVSLTVIPVLSRKYLHPEAEEVLPPSPTALDRLKWRFKGWFEQIDAVYQNALTWSLAHRKTVVLACRRRFPGQFASCISLSERNSSLPWMKANSASLCNSPWGPAWRNRFRPRPEWKRSFRRPSARRPRRSR